MMLKQRSPGMADLTTLRVVEPWSALPVSGGTDYALWSPGRGQATCEGERADT